MSALDMSKQQVLKTMTDGGIAGHHPAQEGGPVHERPRRVEAAGA